MGEFIRNRVERAIELSYDNTTSGLAATDVQAAIDELAAQTASNDDLVIDEDLEFVVDDDLTSVEQEH